MTHLKANGTFMMIVHIVKKLGVVHISICNRVGNIFEMLSLVQLIREKKLTEWKLRDFYSI